MTGSWESIYKERSVPLDRALDAVKRGDRVFLGSACAEPQYLVQGLIDRAGSLNDVQILHYVTLGDASYTEQRFDTRFRHNAFFVGPNTREAINQARADYTPVFVSQIPDLFRRRIVPIDVALIMTTPPDEHGFISLGVSVDVVKAAAQSAKVVIAQINRFMPRTMGDTFIHVSKIDWFVEHDAPLIEFLYPPIHDKGADIAKQVVKLINDGDTIHIGFGHTPYAILPLLNEKKDLGVHTEVVSDSIIDLIEAGVITNEKKTLHPGKVVCSFCIGSRRIYDYVAGNPLFAFFPAEYVYNPLVIAQNRNMVALTSALEVDLSGQVCSESKGHFFHSGVGGRLDFIRGAVMSEGGRSIITLPSTNSDGTESRIVPHLAEGSGVVATRGDVQYIVTEYGIAYMQGKSVRERAMALISIAHPSFRKGLLEEAKRNAYVYPDQIFIQTGDQTYPEEEERSVTLEDGTEAIIRPIKPTDETLLQDFFYSHTDETIYRRYFRAVKAMTHSQAQVLTNVDYDKTMAFVATVGEIGMERIIGVGRYIAEEEGIVEAAYTIREDYHHKGLGTILQDCVEDYAKKKGYKGVCAYMIATNMPVIKLFRRRGFYHQEYDSAGIVKLWRIFDEMDEAGPAE